MTARTCPMIARNRWEGADVGHRSALHLLSRGQNPVGLSLARTAAWLVFLNGSHRGEDARLVLGATTIGSAWNAQLVLTAPDVRSHHATLRLGEDAATILRGAQGNAVDVNGARISEATPLHDGDLIAFAELQAVLIFARPYFDSARPAPRPRPVVHSPNGGARLFTTAWLVATSGSIAGRDWRLTNGENRIGSAHGCEVTLGDNDIPAEALRLAGDLEGTKIVAAHPCVSIDGRPAKAGDILRDSARVRIHTAELYFKCL